VRIGEEVFKARGYALKEPNFLEVYKFDRMNDVFLPNFVEGDSFMPNSF